MSTGTECYRALRTLLVLSRQLAKNLYALVDLSQHGFSMSADVCQQQLVPDCPGCIGLLLPSLFVYAEHEQPQD
jgi:hypothetical protein